MTTARKPAPGTDEDWVSLAQAARLLNETRHTVLVRAVKGEVTIKHIAGRAVVSRASIDACLAVASQGSERADAVAANGAPNVASRGRK